MNSRTIQSVDVEAGRAGFLSQLGWSRLLGSVAMALVVAIPVARGADGDGGGSTDRGGGDGGGAGGPYLTDEEMVGTLPIVVPGNPEDGEELNAELRPSFFFEGPFGQLLGGVVQINSGAHVSLEPSHVPGCMRARYYGLIDLDYDAAALADGTVTGGMIGSAPFGDTAATIVHNGQAIGSFIVDGGKTLTLPIAQMQALGILDDGVDIFTRDLSGERGHIRLQEYGGLVHLTVE